jgi:hypothetical protein
MKEQTFMTKHPEGKQGVNISKAKYDTMKAAMVGEMKGKGEVPLKDILEAVENKLTGKFEGSVPWYFESVKLDLEAKKVIERVPGKKPQHVRLIE